MSLLRQRHCQHSVAYRGPLAQGAAAAPGPFEITCRQVHAERDGAIHLILSKVQDLGGSDGWAKDAKHRPSVKAPRHHRRNEVGRHPLHDLVTGGKTGEEVPAGGAGGFRSHKGTREDAGARMSEHAEGIQLAARHGHLRVAEGRSTLGHPGAVHHDGGAVAHTRFFRGDELHALLASRRLRAEEHGGETVKRDALGAIDHRGREIVIAQPYDPLRKLPAERCHTCLRYAAEVLPLVWESC